MTTSLYFHDATYNTAGGTYPSGEQSSTTETTVGAVAGSTTLRQMDTSLGVGQVVASSTVNPGTSAARWLFRMFVSPTLNGSQTVGGGTANLYCANQESNTNANFWINGVNVYVWRPSTGAKIGTLKDWAGTSMGGGEPPGTAESGDTFSFTTSAISAADGDVVICEVWSGFTQGMSSTYTKSFYYDGATDLTGVTQGASVSDAGSLLLLAETLTFTQPVVVIQPSFLRPQIIIIG